MPTITNIDSEITRNLSQTEKDLGVDLKLTNTGDLELNNVDDFVLIAGGANAAQAIKIQLAIEPGSLLYHPSLGTGLAVGSKVIDAFEIKTQILRSLSKDVRFEDVNAKVIVDGSAVLIDMVVRIKNTDQQVPLQFAVTI